MALHYDPIGTKRLTISSSCTEDIILFRNLHLIVQHIAFAQISLWFFPEILFILWEGPLHIDPHYLCQVSGYSRIQHFLYALRIPRLWRAAFPYHRIFALSYRNFDRQSLLTLRWTLPQHWIAVRYLEITHKMRLWRVTSPEVLLHLASGFGLKA